MFKLKNKQLRIQQMLAENGFQPKSDCFVAAAVIGGAVISAGVGAAASSSAASKMSGAANNAADATLEATQETNALNYEIYLQNLQNESPALQVSQEATAALASGFGLGTPNTGANQINGPAPSAFGSSYVNSPNMGSGIPGSGIPATSSIGTPPSGATAQGVNPNVSAFRGGTSLTSDGVPNPSPLAGGTTPNYGTLDGNGGSQVNLAGGTLQLGGPGTGPSGNSPLAGGPAVYGQSFAPSGGSGPTANIPGIGNVGTVNAGATQGQLNAGGASQAPGSLLANFSNKDLTSQIAPSYGFELNQGLATAANNDAAHGVSGGNFMNNQIGFAENTASTYYQQAFSNYLTQQQQNINSLSVLAGNGATGIANNAGTSAAGNITSNTQQGVNSANNFRTSGASASAAGNIGVANSVTGAIGQGTSGYFTNQLINNSLNNNSVSNPGNVTPNYGSTMDVGGGYIVNTPGGATDGSGPP